MVDPRFYQRVHSTVNSRYVYHLNRFHHFHSISQMELINECSMRFAEDKDFRLLVNGPTM
jgi:hypothetical protein